ncbi:MAG: pyruvate, phosphate dikinase [Christensenellales bacterium]
MAKKKFVYMFSEGNANMREILGGKGANLAEMTNLGMPVPSGYTISTEACNDYFKNGNQISEEIKKQILNGLKQQEKLSGKKFGDLNNPLLVSVRSGARISMPGMMDTILNLGLNDQTVETMAKASSNEWWAYDCYRRLIQMFGEVAMGANEDGFEKIIESAKAKQGVKLDKDLSVDSLKKIIAEYKKYIKKQTKQDFPQNPLDQLYMAVEAVFRSWQNDRAIIYRRMNDIPEEWGTAVNIQEMVFGNLNEQSGTGVAFSRDPSTGENKIYGEFMWNAQGEDIVSGARTPLPIEDLNKTMPKVYKQFVGYVKKLEKHYHDMQDMEFTIENGKLFFLQTRNGKRTAMASLNIAVDLVNEKISTKERVIKALDPKLIDTLLHNQFDPKVTKTLTPLAVGLAASPGAACGKIVLNADKAKELGKNKVKTILIRQETSPKDIEGMQVCEAVLTARGGMTSHAAVVARGLGEPCVVGCGSLQVFEEEGYVLFGDKKLVEGDVISVDGSTGNVYLGEVASVPASISGNFKVIMDWCKQIKKIGVMANADTPADVKTAIGFGAEGVGLVRTEHMFFKEDKILSIREMIVAQNLKERQNALKKLLVLQREDFVGIFSELKELHATIRLIDPPLHEFLPHTEEEQRILAKATGKTYEQIVEIVNSLAEFNPMMGHRGCRLAVTYPEIAEMQTRAIIEAAILVSKKQKISVCPEIMIPLTSATKEFEFVKDIVEQTAKKVIAEKKFNVDYKIGTMIETPRAVVIADKLAERCDFFSFGTNDLTQLSFGFSRDDASKFINDYYDKKILDHDPFVRLDEEGVGELIKHTVKLARGKKANFKIGVCGEQGSNSDSVKFLLNAGVSYVSCSPYRVPIAILSAAIASIK